MEISKLNQKKRGWLKKLYPATIVFCLLLLSCENGFAQTDIIRKGFTFGGTAGFGSIGYRHDINTNSSDKTLALGFHGGYAITRNTILGLELNGWTIKEFDLSDPSVGESVSTTSIFLNVFPIKNIPFYLSGGVGKSYYTNNSTYVNGRETGSASFIGCGYELPLSQRLSIGPQFRYSQGSFSGGKYSVSEIALAIHWYSNW
jgi:hypothetical protein